MIDEGLLLTDATSVHTLGMRFPILVARLDDSLRVVDVRRLVPYRLVAPIRRARHVLECHPDADLRLGDVLRVDSELSSEPGRGISVAILPKLPPGRGRGEHGSARAPIV